MDIKSSVMEVQLGILEQVIDRELKVSLLYEKFAESFSEQQELWSGLSKEEQGHANLLRGMEDFIRQGHLLWNLGRLKGAVCEAEGALITDAEIKLRLGRLDITEALKIAIRIENSLFDSKFYDVVNCEFPAFQKIAADLRHDEALHKNRLKHAISEFLGTQN